uniref:Uncharacterized protein n=1 Tax=Fagus sylvatica TaxID=28930 RepID=A0A2N9F6R6_FAGSY
MSRKARQFWQPNGKPIHLPMHIAFMHTMHTHTYLAMVYPQSKPRMTERVEEKKKAMINERQKEIYPTLSLSKAAQTLPTPRRPAFHVPRPSSDGASDNSNHCQFQSRNCIRLLVKKKMITPVGPRTRIGPQPKDYNKDLSCEYHQGEVGHTVENCKVLRHHPVGAIHHAKDTERISGSRRTLKNSVRRRRKNWESSRRPHHRRCPKLNPVVIQYAAKEKIVLQTASVISIREGKPETEEEVVGNLTSGLSGITRSGRCYTPEELEKRRKEIGKVVEDPTKTKAAEEEAADFLRIIKSSEYSVVKQLSKMPFLIYRYYHYYSHPESHRRALLKVLNEAYVPEDITGPSFENMVTSILVTNQLTFSDDELPPRGKGPHQSLVHFSQEPNNLISVKGSTSMVVRAFDGTSQGGDRRNRIANRDWPASLRHQFPSAEEFDSPYNLLLGRPWLHTAGAVPSFPTPKDEVHHWKLIGHHPSRRSLYPFYNDGEIPYIDGAKEFIKAGFRPGTRPGLREPRKNRDSWLSKGNKGQIWPWDTPPLEEIARFAYEASKDEELRIETQRGEMA